MEEEVVLVAPRCPGFSAVHTAAILTLMEHEKPPKPTGGKRLGEAPLPHPMRVPLHGAQT